MRGRLFGHPENIMQDEEIFSTAFGAFFAWRAPAMDDEPQAGCRHSVRAKEAYVNTFLEYRRAAEAGNRSAQEMLGLMYLYGSQLYGEGVRRDLREATHWLELAAAQDSMLARQLLRRYVLSHTDRGLDSHLPDTATRDGPELTAAI